MRRRIYYIFEDHRLRLGALIAAAYVLAILLGAGLALVQSGGQPANPLIITPLPTTPRMPRPTIQPAVEPPVIVTTEPTLPGALPPVTPFPTAIIPAGSPFPPLETIIPPAGTPPPFGTVPLPTPTLPGAPSATPGPVTPYPPGGTVTAIAQLPTATLQSGVLPTGVPGVAIQSQGYYTTTYGGLVVLGEVRNNSTRLLGTIGMHFWVYDAQQLVVGEGDLWSDLIVLPSGASSSFAWPGVVDDPAAVARVEIRVVDAPDGSGTPVEGVKVISQEVAHVSGQLIVTGVAENTTDVAITSMSIYAIILDPVTHQPVRWAAIDGDALDLPPHETVEFVLIADDVASLDEQDIRYYFTAG